MKNLSKLATKRAALAGAIMVLLEMAKHLGLPVPEGTERVVNAAIDASMIIVPYVTTLFAHHAEKPSA